MEGYEGASLPPDFGTIDGEDHPDTIIANSNWNAAIDAALREFPGPAYSGLLVRRRLEQLRR